MKNKEGRIFPPDCRCHVLARSQVTFPAGEAGVVTNDIAARAVRSVFCPVHMPHNYLPRFLSAGQAR